MNNDHIIAPSADKPIGRCSNGLFTLYTVDDFDSFPEMTWLIDDILPSSGLASVYGQSGVGKSFLCLDMAASVATGLPWFGHQTSQCHVVYISLEGQAGFRRRVRAWQEHREISLTDKIHFLDEMFEFNRAGHPDGLINIIEKSGGAGLIIIDTLNKAAPGADENSSSDMGRIIAAASSIQKATNGLVLLVHHSGKDASRGLRGHSSLHAALDTVIETEKDGQLIRWNLVKSKDGEDGISHSFSLVPVEIGEDKTGKAIMSCAVQEAEGVTSSKKLSEPRGTNQKVILAAVQDIFLQQQIQNSTDSPDSQEGMTFATLLSELKDVLIDTDLKHRQSRTKEALDALIRQGYLVISDGMLKLPVNNTSN
jgi:hypothetical protein